MAFPQDIDTRLHVLGHAMLAVEKAARRDAILLVDATDRQLRHDFPNSSMSLDELRVQLLSLAVKRRVAVQIGIGDEELQTLERRTDGLIRPDTLGTDATIDEVLAPSAVANFLGVAK